MKTAVIVHGQHLQSKNWEESVWGTPKKGIYGRVPAGLREALRFDAKVILFGTGSSKKDGLTDGEYALKLARDRILEVPEFAGWDEEAALSWLDERAVVENTAQTTVSEIIANASIALDRGVERIVLVSSPTHIMRAHKIAISEFSKDERFKHFLHSLYAVSSDVSYANSTVDDVLIIEPPHRGDNHSVNFAPTLKGVLAFNYKDGDLAQELNNELKSLIDRFIGRLK